MITIEIFRILTYNKYINNELDIKDSAINSSKRLF